MGEQYQEKNYTLNQHQMILLYNALREALMFRKYYARRMVIYRRWDIGGDILIALSASTSLTGATIFKTYVGDKMLTIILFFSMLVTILKPFLKLNRQVITFSKLQSSYMDLYQKLNRLRHDVRKAGKFEPKLDARFTALQNTFDRLGLRNDPTENERIKTKIQDQIEKQIPDTSLWLPPSE